MTVENMNYRQHFGSVDPGLLDRDRRFRNGMVSFRPCDQVIEEGTELLTPPRPEDRKLCMPSSIPPPPALGRRATSEPLLSKCSNRRAIFGKFWHARICAPASEPDLAGALGPAARTSPYVQPQRKKAATPTCTKRKDSLVDMRKLSPPKEFIEARSTHFRHIQDLPVDVLLALPAVPSPLQRFYQEDGNCACLAGAYPLTPPQSILRHSSYRKLDSLENESACSSSPRPTPSQSNLFNLTESVRFDYDPMEVASDFSSHSSSQASSKQNRSVQFDPRVTVTEYSDDFERQWYSEVDLERFKTETVALAQKFLMKHPNLIEKYNKPRMDPVTCTLRKRALFSLPILHDTDLDQVQDYIPRLWDTDEISEFAFYEISNILVVDRNRLILNLFRKSLQNLFPYAKITTVDSAEEAWDLYQQAQARDKSRSGHASKSYDLIISEERLHRPLSRKPLGKTFSMPKSLNGAADSQDNLHRRSCSDFSPVHEVTCRMSGSQLFRNICECNYAFDDQQGPLWVPLLIGVSIQPDAERRQFLDNGADMVWGKPPPTMDQALGFELTMALARKRKCDCS